VYEARRLADAPPGQFRAFVLKCFGAVAESSTGVPPVNHGRDGHATTDAHAATLNIRKGARLPHWTMDDASYAVTFRLGDSLPKEVLDAWLFERENIVKTAEQLGRPLSADEEKRLDYLHSEKVGKYLDAGHGACWMKQDRIARIVADALKHFDGERYDLLAWCVMLNHVHVVVKPYAGHELPDILHSWKSFTAHEANKAVKRKGQFWEEEYYDHLIRDEADYVRCVEYVLANPEKAGLEDWKWIGITGVSPVDHARDGHATIHGYKGAIPVWVGDPKQSKGATAADVQAFANAMRKTLHYKQDNLRDGIMLAWAFRPDAMEAAERLRQLEQTDLNFIRLDTIRIDSPRFREHVTALSTHNADYENFLTFVQPPKVEAGFKRIGAKSYVFDVSETVVMNAGVFIQSDGQEGSGAGGAVRVPDRRQETDRLQGAGRHGRRRAVDRRDRGGVDCWSRRPDHECTSTPG
jgi:REP element-mobilizing transposase RayT